MILFHIFTMMLLCLQTSHICYLKWYRKLTPLFARLRLESYLYLEQYLILSRLGALDETPTALWSMLRRAETWAQNHDSRSKVLRLQPPKWN